ncbi:uncharacterized protein LOC141613608 [Silene latifolia]|uniref:uncharacterized protein LOC141613608 n=1 Tax=Silene latifolia TaxID=37657 RepID=UPI003D77174B
MPTRTYLCQENKSQENKSQVEKFPNQATTTSASRKLTSATIVSKLYTPELDATIDPWFFYICNKPGHRANDCPEKKDAPTPKSKPRGTIFVMSRAEAAAHQDITTGMFSILDQPCLILFDIGASLSFISSKFSETLALDPIPSEDTTISLPSGEIISCSYSFSDVPILISGIIFPANLLRFPLEEFDVIFDMDWLSTYYTRFKCRDQKIFLKSLLGTRVSYKGVRSQVVVKYISALKMVNLLRKGCQALICVVTSTEVSLPKIEEVPVVCEFTDVFPDELPGVPPKRDVEFSIDLVAGTGPIAKAPYHIAPTELKELKKQLYEIIEK